MTQRVQVFGSQEYEKVEMPVYTQDSPKMAFLHLRAEFINMMDTYDLETWESPPCCYHRFQAFLMGGARDQWDEIVQADEYQPRTLK